MDKRVLRVRFWLCTLLATACLASSPFWLWTLLPAAAFGMGAGCCCGGGGVPSNCTFICSTSPASQYQVLIAGITNLTCASCDDYNGTWTLTEGYCINDGDLCRCFGARVSPCLCWWTADADFEDGGKFAVRDILMSLRDTGGGLESPYIQVAFNSNPINEFSPATCDDQATLYHFVAVWENPNVAPIDCGGLSSYVVNFWATIAPGCDFDSSTATVTAL